MVSEVDTFVTIFVAIQRLFVLHRNILFYDAAKNDFFVGSSHLIADGRVDADTSDDVEDNDDDDTDVDNEVWVDVDDNDDDVRDGDDFFPTLRRRRPNILLLLLVLL